MGNGQSTSQRIEQIIQNYSKADAESTATAECTQDITVDSRGAVNINCNGIKIEQRCNAVSNASLDTVVKALQSAKLDSEAQQHAEGVALSLSISKTDNDMVSKTLNQLVANCRSNAESVADQTHYYDFRDMLWDCTANPGSSFLLEVTQYNDADAACVVKQIVALGQKNESKALTKQKTIGLTLPDFGAIIAVLALLLMAPLLMGEEKREDVKNFYNRMSKKKKK